MLLTQCYYHRGKWHEEVVHLQSVIPPKSFDIFPPDWGMLRWSGILVCKSRSKFEARKIIRSTFANLRPTSNTINPSHEKGVFGHENGVFGHENGVFGHEKGVFGHEKGTFGANPS